MSSSCNKTKSEAEINYNFEKDQYFPISNREALTKIEDFVKYSTSSTRDDEDELINLDEALFIFEGSMNYLKANPEETDQTTLIENTFDIMIPAEFDENNGTYLISTSDIANALDEANIQIESILGEGNHTEEKKIQLADARIEYLVDGGVKFKVNAISGNTFNTSDLWEYNLFPEDEHFYAVAEKYGDISGFIGPGSPGNISCNFPNTSIPSSDLINHELNQKYFPLLEREEQFIWTNITIPYYKNANSILPYWMNPDPDCQASNLNSGTTWGCMDWLWFNDGIITDSFFYPLTTQPSDITDCIQGNQLNTYMEKTDEYLQWLKTYYTNQQGFAVSIASFEYYGSTIYFGTSVFGTNLTGPTYRAHHGIKYRFGHKLYQ